MRGSAVVIVQHMQVEDNTNQKLGLSQGWPWLLYRGEHYWNYSNWGEKNWQLTILLQGDCLIQCRLIWSCLTQIQLYNDHLFHNEIDVLNYFSFWSINYSSKEEHFITSLEGNASSLITSTFGWLLKVRTDKIYPSVPVDQKPPCLILYIYQIVTLLFL